MSSAVTSGLQEDVFRGDTELLAASKNEPTGTPRGYVGPPELSGPQEGNNPIRTHLKGDRYTSEASEVTPDLPWTGTYPNCGEG